jgi:hypothetical protein
MLRVLKPNIDGTFRHYNIDYYDTVTNQKLFVQIVRDRTYINDREMLRVGFGGYYKNFLISQFEEINNEDFFGATWPGAGFLKNFHYRPEGDVVARYCDGQDLKEVSMPDLDILGNTVVPFNLIINTTNDAPVCLPLNTDLHIVSIDVANNIISASVAIYAEGSYPPFEYSIDGINWQSSNAFTVTNSGTYVGYVRNITGYIDTREFIVDLDTYGLKFFGSFNDLEGSTYHVEIFNYNYTGSVNIIDYFGGEPVKRKYMQEGDNKFKPIKGSELELYLISQTNFQFQEFYANDWRQYRIRYYKNLINLENLSNLASIEKPTMPAAFSPVAQWVQDGDSIRVTKGVSGTVYAQWLAFDIKDFDTGQFIYVDIEFERFSLFDYEVKIFGYDEDTLTIFNLNQSYDSKVVGTTGAITTLRACIINNYDAAYNIKKIVLEFKFVFGPTVWYIKLNKFRVRSMKFTGYISPDSYSEPFLSPPYESVITFTDGLGVLKEIDYRSPSGELQFGDSSLIGIIKECLDNIALKLPIYSMPGVEYNVNNYNEASPPYYDALRYAFVKREAFLKGEEPMNCYEVLEAILKAFGIRIYQNSGVWFIEAIHVKKNDTFRLDEYSNGGQYTTTITALSYIKTIDLNNPDGVIQFTSQSQVLEFAPAYKEYNIVADNKDTLDILLNQNFKYLKENKPAFIIDNFGLLSIGNYINEGKSQNTARIDGDGSNTGWNQYIMPLTGIVDKTILPFSVINLKVKFIIKSGSDNAEIKIMLKSGPWYHTVSSAPVKDEEFLRLNRSATLAYIITTVSCNSVVELNMQTYQNAMPGDIELRLYQGKSTVAQDIDYIDFIECNLSFVNEEIPIGDKREFKAANEGRYTLTPEDEKAIITEGIPEYPVSSNTIKGALYTYVDYVSGNFVKGASRFKWRKRGDATNQSLLTLMSNIKLNEYIRPMAKLKGTLYVQNYINLCDILEVDTMPGKRFMFTAAEYSDKSNLVRVELIELSDTDLNQYRLLEDGLYRLLENNTYRLLEQ